MKSRYDFVMRPAIQRLEQAAANALPPLIFQLDEGWRLRYNANVTRRANSVLAEHHLDAPNQALLEKIVRAEAFYAQWGRRARFQLCPASQPSNLNAVLAARGYTRSSGAAVQRAPLTKVLGRVVRQMPPDAVLSATLTEDWLKLYAQIERLDASTIEVRRTLFSRIPSPTAFVTVRMSGFPVAVGLGVLEQTQLGMFNMATLPTMRRRGAASAVIHTLAVWGAQMGAAELYLQVAEENRAAHSLYTRLGFQTLYTYHYLEAP